MKAMLVKRSEGVAVLALEELSDPAPGPGDVLVAVRAASVNRADILQRAGTYVLNTSSGPERVGLDVAGDIIAVGDAVQSLHVGDRVMAMTPGGLAERVVVDAAMAVPLPSTWSYDEGAAAIVALMTEHNAIRAAARLQAGESILIHAAASGVGLQAVQLARFLGAGTVIATARSSRAQDLLTSLGANHVIDTSRERFAERVLDVTRGEGVDVIIDHVGGPYLADNVACAAVRARLVGVGRLGGSRGALDMETLALKRMEIIGVTFRTRSATEKVAIVSALRNDLDRPGAYESLRPTVDRTLPWTEALVAQEVMESNAHLGKIVLNVSPGSG